MDSNTYTRLLELPNEQVHAIPPYAPQQPYLEVSPYFNHRTQKAPSLRLRMEIPISLLL